MLVLDDNFSTNYDFFYKILKNFNPTKFWDLFSSSFISYYLFLGSVNQLGIFDSSIDPEFIEFCCVDDKLF